MIDPTISARETVVASARTLRQFAALWLVLFAGFGGWHWFVRNNARAALIFAVIAVVVGLVGMIRPFAIRPLFSGLMAVATPIGWIVSRVLLATLFYAMFTPVAVLFKLIGRDALALRPHATRDTYWTEKPEPGDLRSYLRQS